MLLDDDVAPDIEHVLNVGTSNNAAIHMSEDATEDRSQDVIQDNLLMNHRVDIVEDVIEDDSLVDLVIILETLKTDVSFGDYEVVRL